MNDVLDIYTTHYINRGNISADTLNVSYSSGGAQVFGDYDANQENFDTSLIITLIFLIKIE